MLRNAVVGLALVLAACSASSAQEWAQKMFSTTSHDFGTVARDSKTEFRFPVKNLYMEDVHIASVRSSCGCTIASIETDSLKTHEQGAILAQLNTKKFSGQRGATLTVTIDRPYHAEVLLHVRGYIRGDVVFNPGSVQVGQLSQGKAADYKVSVNYAGRSDWQVVQVVSANPHLTGKVVETRRAGGYVSYELDVHLDEHAPAGYLKDQILLVTNDANGTQVPLAVEGVIQPDVVVSPASLFMGVVQPGGKVTKQLVVRGKQPFRILSVQIDGEYFQVDTADKDAAKPVHLVPVTFAAGDASGRVAGKIRIETDLGNNSPELPAYAVVAAGQEEKSPTSDAPAE